MCNAPRTNAPRCAVQVCYAHQTAPPCVPNPHLVYNFLANVLCLCPKPRKMNKGENARKY